MNISENTLEALADLLCSEAVQEREIDLQREVLAQQNDFVLLNIFRRLSSTAEAMGASDDHHNNAITSLDLLGFFRQNGKVISERECYLLLSQYDSNHDGKLSFSDFQLMLSPQGYTLQKNIKNTQKFYSYGGKPQKLSYDVEIAVLMTFIKMIDGLKIVETKKQELITQYDWSALEAFRIIDEYSHGNVNNDNLRVFLRQYDSFASVAEEDMTKLIRKYDKDSDKAWSFREFINAINPLSQFSLKAKDLDKVHIDNINITAIQNNDTTNGGSVLANNYRTDYKENMKPGSVSGERHGPAFSKASKSTTAMSLYKSGGGQNYDGYSYISGSGNMTGGRGDNSATNGGRGSQLLTYNADDGIFNMKNMDSAVNINFSTNGKGQNKQGSAKGDQSGKSHQYGSFQRTHGDLQMNSTNIGQYKSFGKDEVLNYPYLCDEQNQTQQFQESQLADRIKIMNESLKKQEVKKITREDPSDFKTQLVQAFIDMMQVEGSLEKKRRELALRSDFNLNDAYKLFNSVKNHRKGIDVDDLYYVLKEYLKITLTKDEVFILFYKLDRDGDGFICYSELSNAFIPNQHEYAILIQGRQAFYGPNTDPREYFSKETRDFLRRGIRGLVDCEVSIELIKQRLYNKIRLNCESAFHQIDQRGKGMVTIDDLRDYLKSANVFAVEKELQLLFQRIDKDENGIITLPEFVSGISPFNNK
eukprot:403364375